MQQLKEEKNKNFKSLFKTSTENSFPIVYF